MRKRMDAITTMLAVTIHHQAIDVALYAHRLPTDRATPWIRGLVNPAARKHMQHVHGDGYQDWVRSQYELWVSRSNEARQARN